MIDSLWLGKLRLESFEVVVEEWHAFFAKVPVNRVKRAIIDYSGKGTPFPPTAPEIMSLVISDLAQGYPSPDAFAHNVKTAVIQFGSHGADTAKAFLGEEEWAAAMSVASWQSHCNRLDEAKLKAAWEYRVKQIIKTKMEENNG